ncbi:MAG: PEP-CTERM sorting domain-containing protein [Rhodocyclaceae bacterium]|nr:PEP-CTERM sorting domain-containing protein [Rhodocyclaceae bacterium]
MQTEICCALGYSARIYGWRSVVAIALLTLGALSTPAAGVETTWVGGTGDWGDASNWSNGQPGATDVAVIRNGRATLDFDTSILGLMQSGGQISGVGVLSVFGDAIWTTGEQRGDGTTFFTGNLFLSGGAAKVIQSGRVIEAVSTVWSGNTASNSGAIEILTRGTFNNLGNFDDSNEFDSSIFNGASGGTSFHNSATYNKNGMATTAIATPFINSGTLNVNAGTIRIASDFTNEGAVRIAEGATFAGRANAKATTSDDARLDNFGTISPGRAGAEIGTLALNGDLNLASSSNITLELSSRTVFDKIFLTGDVDLGGELTISSDGGYTPAAGDSFIVMTFAQNLGDSTFEKLTTNGFNFAPGLGLEVSYNANNVTVIVAAIPEPSQYMMMLAGLGLVGAMVRRRRMHVKLT